MQTYRALVFLGCLFMGAAAQNDNDNNDSSSTTLGPRESAVTIVETSFEVVTMTNTDQSVYITSLPKSLYTRTTQVAAQTTLVPVLTQSVISSGSVFVSTSTGMDGQLSETTVIPTGATVVPAGAGGSGVTSPGGASSTSTGGAYATAIPAGVAVALMGFAAAL